MSIEFSFSFQEKSEVDYKLKIDMNDWRVKTKNINKGKIIGWKFFIILGGPPAYDDAIRNNQGVPTTKPT